MLAKMITHGTVTMALAGAAVLGTGGQAHATTANEWASIAISVRTGHLGYAYNYPSSGGAQRAAVAKCGTSDCQAVVVVANGCAAVAQARNRAWGWAYAASPASATSRAVSATPGPGARGLGWACSGAYQAT